MAFTAVHPHAGPIDATCADLGCGLDWSEVYRVRPRIALVCPECGFGVHAKLSPRRLRYFAHDPGRPADCEMSNESIEHHFLKLELATAIRAAGWHAQLEVRAEDGSWRADVMATSADGTRRMAWEAQLSPITDTDLLDRTGRYTDEGIDVCWVSPHEHVPWLGKGPAVRVQAPPDDGKDWFVADGLARFDEPSGAWLIVEQTSLETFVRWALAGQVYSHQVLPRYRRIHLGAVSTARRTQIWTTERSAEAEVRHDAMRQRQEARKAERQRRELEAEQLRQAKEKAEQEERERQRKIQEEARRAEQAEKDRLWKIEWDKRQAILDAERRARQEEERKSEAERQERKRQELLAAERWWAEVSPAQWQELLAAIADQSLKQLGKRAAPTGSQTQAEYAYGIPLYAAGRLYGVARPHPGSLHRLIGTAPIFVRSAREAEQILAHEGIDTDRVIHFNLPDHEQLELF